MKKNSLTLTITIFIPFVLILVFSSSLENAAAKNDGVSSCIPFPWVNTYFCSGDCDCCQTSLGSPVPFVCNNTQRCVSGNNLAYTCSPTPIQTPNPIPNPNDGENSDRCITSQKICKPLETFCCSLDEAVSYTCPSYSRCCRTPGFPCSTDCDCCQYDYNKIQRHATETETGTEAGKPIPIPIPTPAYCNAQRICEKIPVKVECPSWKMN